MENKKNINRKFAIGIVAGIVLTMTFSFMAGNKSGSDKSEAVETFYGRTIFSREFVWLDNVKRPGLSAAFSNAGALAFDFSTSSAMPDTFVNLSQDLVYIASPSFLPNGLVYNGPFDNEAGPGGLFTTEQASPEMYPMYSGGGSGGDNRGSSTLPLSVSENIYANDLNYDDNSSRDNIDSLDDIDDNEIAAIVPVPGAALLAAIGVMAISAIRKK